MQSKSSPSGPSWPGKQDDYTMFPHGLQMACSLAPHINLTALRYPLAVWGLLQYNGLSPTGTVEHLAQATVCRATTHI